MPTWVSCMDASHIKLSYFPQIENVIEHFELPLQNLNIRDDRVSIEF